jgi:acetolactate synthase-1/2/3 large subunit
MWAAQVWPFRQPRAWLTSGGLGTMGFGLPAAIGAALARPDRPNVCITGDGSFLMNIQELATLAELRLPVAIVLLNNNGYGLVRQQQELFYGERYMASLFDAKPDYCTIARGFGIEAIDLADDANPAESAASATLRALEIGRPVLLHMPVPAGEMVFPMVAPGAANRDMIERQKATQRVS